MFRAPTILSKKIAYLSILLFMSSCFLTNKMWHHYYNDDIDSFITTRSGTQVAFLGKKFHYIFDDRAGALKEILFWKRRKILYIDVESTRLKVDQFGNVNGHVAIKSTYLNPEPRDQKYLYNLGFYRNKDGYLEIELPLYGKRYIPDSRRYKDKGLNKPYRLKIEYEERDNPAITAGKVAISPITITLDAVIWLGEHTIGAFIRKK